MVKQKVFLMVALILSLIVLVASCSSEKNYEIDEDAVRKAEILRAEEFQDFREDYCEGKYMDYTIDLSNAKSDVEKFKMDLDDLKEDQAEFPEGSSKWDIYAGRISRKMAYIEAEQEDVKIAQGRIEAIKEECSGVLTVE